MENAISKIRSVTDGNNERMSIISCKCGVEQTIKSDIMIKALDPENDSRDYYGRKMTLSCPSCGKEWPLKIQ